MQKLPWCLLVAGLLLALSHPLQAMYPSGTPMRLLHSPDALTLAGREIRIEAEPYLNLMPRIIPPATAGLDCTASGPLIILIRFNVPALPDQVKAEKVWLHAAGTWWQGTINGHETRNENGQLVMIARGCPDPALQPGALSTVIIELQYQQLRYHLQSFEKELEAVY